MNNRKFTIIMLILLLITAFGSFYSLPYYIQKPGSAFALDDIVNVDNKTESEGDFSLMTVSQAEASIFGYIWAQFNDYQEIFPVEEVRSPHESEDEYSVRQLYLMDNSASQAIEVAFNEADAQYSYEYFGVYILNVFPEMPADGVLRAGDRITKVDDVQFESSEEFIDYVSAKEAGESVDITYVRDENEETATLELKAFPDNENQVGLGISLVDDREITTDPDVSINSDGIGGPSAGLMYALEIYDQLIDEDLTSGKMIAGTGTINSDGEVGRIGGIAQKVVAADRQDIEVFFAPDDEVPAEILEQNPGVKSNYEEALETARDIGTDMEIVPVKTFDDAISYLDGI
ncbi:SepM family pheromone-processing serine protease [Jeotgalibacillus sp. R-1-5s-1]|uniref:SepM family pheromone-processing serine protease n=1 Tax=Jeotgalibacillus sp. R-1-5s-1 TaxID=2555897 RepID=UPI00106D89CD|nr:SepM family pheromone-processing serine protease [Jeotgalibacillus sp. R-1-5s-1]TFE03594.1 PDZ domain-containing protein [Jeotgalibacillus sp. R-1-5s-1]